MSDELPQGWADASLNDVVYFQEGPGLRKWQFGESGIPFLNIRTFENGRINRSKCQFVKMEEFTDKYEHFLLNEGDLVVSSSGTLGKVATVRPEDLPLMLNTSTIRFRARYPQALAQDFLRFYVQSHHFFRQIDSAKTGSAILNYGPSHLKQMSIVLAPLAEQRRIVAKLTELLDKVDACQQRLAKIPVLLKRFRQSVLAAACSGRLTADWREQNDNDDSAANLLGSIGAKPLVQDEFDTPENWCWSRFGDLVSNHDGRRIPVKQSDRDKRSGPYPYYGAFGIIDDIDEYLYDGDYLLLAEDGKNLESRLRPISLIATGKFWVNNHAHVLQSKGGIPLSFLNSWLNSPTLDLSPFLTGIDQVKLNRAAMDRIPVPVAPLAEQQEIVRRVEALFALADQIEARFRGAQMQVAKLTPALLAKAFRGQLVPQDPTDEPAEKLLARIRKGSKQ